MGLYAINVEIFNASTGFYCSVTFNSGTLSDGVGQCTPARAEFTYMSFQGAINFQIPPGDAICGGTITATSSVAGSISVSPPINVPTTVKLWGGAVLGTYNLPAGQESGDFNFSVSNADAIPQDEVADTIKQFMKRNA
jgi:hypothetical protein